MLNEHPAVVAINEPLIGSYLGPFLSDLDGWDGASLDTENFTLRKVLERKRDQFFCEQFRDVWLPDLGRMMRHRFLAHVLRSSSLELRASQAHVAIKEPNGSQSADLLLPALPRSRALFLLRDGRDVVDSELAANLKGSWVSAAFPGASGIDESLRLAFVEQSAKKWLWRTEVVQRAVREHPGPKLQIRYEDLLADRAGGMREVIDWIGLRASDDEVRALVEKHAFEALPASKRGADKFQRAATPGLWRENLSPEEQAVLDRTIGPKLRELGYET